ncbi:ABC transporter permease [Sutcliffiella horikoshii]|uniref:ABC transporter permease n=1 Tax=Sutcliffiella horikoshii TaxID=79883 RepID=UPI001CBB5E49|nr:ABC transporter permease [Sutcliffiella horikoshii]UAL47184.1 ABC transporter permease [Sutcliffiella horikoshii]
MRRNDYEDKFRDDEDFDLELLELENEVFCNLKEYDVEFPSEEEMMSTIESIRPHVPRKQNMFKPLADLVRHSGQEIFRISPLFWGANGLLVLISLVAFFMADELDPYFTIMILAPLPTIAGVLELMRSKNSGMLELELSLKYSWQELLLSRMLVIGGFNVSVNIAFTAVLSFVVADVWFAKMTLYWLTPFTLLMAVSLVIISRFRKFHIVTVTLVSWIGLGMVMSQTTLFERLGDVPSYVIVLVIIAASIFSLCKMMWIYKRGISYELNH